MPSHVSRRVEAGLVINLEKHAMTDAPKSFLLTGSVSLLYHQSDCTVTSRAGIGIILILVFILTSACSAPTTPEEEKLVLWIEEAAQLMVTHKASCDEMATELAGHWLRHQEVLQPLQAHLKKDYAHRQSLLLRYQSRLKRAMLLGDSVYSHCALIPHFRQRLGEIIQAGL